MAVCRPCRSVSAFCPTLVSDQNRMHEYFMRQALALAGEAAALGEVPVGCVISRGTDIVGRGYNYREAGKNALYHAEIRAIDDACRRLGGWRLWECSLYVTLEPCAMCAGAAANARITDVFFGARDPKNGACGSVINLFSSPFTHVPRMHEGLLAEECSELLRVFFRDLRKNGVRKETEPG